MQSKIHLKSELGKGSLFYFDMVFKYPLPSEEKLSEHQVKKVLGETKQTGKKHKVLLVEDDENVQITLFKILLNTNIG
mgnify:CR=1 FL=1